MTGAKNNDNNPTNCADRLALTVDYDLYAHYLEDSDLTEEKKREFLAALWTIICEFVALGFGVHPIQQAQSSCGELPETSGNPSTGETCVLDSNHPDLIELFKLADAGIPPEAGKDLPT